MAKAAQKNLEGGEIPKVSRLKETENRETFFSEHLKLRATEKALEALENQVEKKGTAKDKAIVRLAWIQSKVKLKNPKVPLGGGVWDTEVVQIGESMLLEG